jgi:hypothetical protein
MSSLYHYSDSDFYLLCVRFYVDDFVFHAQAHFSIGWCVLSLVGFFPSISAYAFWFWEKQTVLVLYISVVHGVAAFLTPV